MPADGGGGGVLGYWALKPPVEILGKLKEKRTQFFGSLDRRGVRRLWQLSYAQAFGMDPNTIPGGGHDTSSLSMTGPDGAYIRFRINETASYVQQQNLIAQGQRPVFKALAINSDYASLAQVETAQNVIDYLYRSNVGEERERECLEADGWFGKGYAWVRWDPEAGDDVTVKVDSGEQWPAHVDMQTGMYVPPEPIMLDEVKRSGAPSISTLFPWELFEEVDSRDSMWVCVQERRSRWETAAHHEDVAEAIIAEPNVDMGAGGMREMFCYDMRSSTDDDVVIWHFYHKRCKAIPAGRYIGFCGNTVLWDRPCPTSKGLPIVEMCSGKFFGSNIGYTRTWDLLAIQEMMDELASTVASNFGKFGNQGIFVYKGTDFDVDRLSAGDSVFFMNPGTEAPIIPDWKPMPANTDWFFEFLLQRMQSQTQLNSVSRGSPDKNITSGQMAALFDEIAIRYQSGRQAALDTYREKLANMILDMVRNYAETPFLVQVAGQSQTPYLREFTSADVAGVRRVVIETMNPMMRSQAGRLQVFEQIRDLPKEERAPAMRGITAGNWEGFVDKDRACDLRITAENEKLLQGVECEVAPTDNPFTHMPEHQAEYEKLLAEPQLNAKGLMALSKHMARHGVAWLQLNPVMADFLGIPRPPPMQGNPAQLMLMATGGLLNPMTAALNPQGPAGAGANEPTGAPGSGGKNQPAAGGAQADGAMGVPLPNPAKSPPGSGAAPKQNVATPA